LQWQREDDAQTKLRKLTRQLSQCSFVQADTLALLGALLSLPQLENSALLNLSPQKQKQRTQEALIAWLAEDADRAPILAVWEDLHWADPSTLELLGLLIDQVPAARLLVLITARPEFNVPWGRGLI
jgi:predicted ATPase